MSVYTYFRDVLALWLPATLSVIVVLAGLRFCDWWLRDGIRIWTVKKLPRQLAMLALTGIGIAIILLMVPAEAHT